MTPTPRPRTPADARRRAGTPPARPSTAGKRRGMDLYHLLSAVVGALAGLVFYSVITPGHLPDEPAVEQRDAKLDLFLRDLGGKLDAEGYFRVTGKVFNSRGETCQRVTVGVAFTDGRTTLSRVVATIEHVPAHEARPFEVRAYAPGAKVFDATVELAQY